MSHRGMFRRKVSSFCPYLPGKYTESEIDDLVFIDGYIPVYDAAEFDKIRTGASETMGGCTKWGGTYTTGVDQKYVQVGVHDWNAVTFEPIGTSLTPFTGVYDGNEINIMNCTYSSTQTEGGLFAWASGGADIKNISIVNFSFSYTGTSPTVRYGLVCGISNTANYSNITISNSSLVSTQTNSTTSFQAGIAIGRIVIPTTDITLDSIAIINSSITRTQTRASYNVNQGLGVCIGSAGGGGGAGTITVSNSYCDSMCVINDSSHCTGGFIGGIGQNAVVNDCYSLASVNAIVACGGFVGYSAGEINRCYCTGDLVTGNAFAVGGFAGYAATPSVFNQCYCTGAVTNTSGNATGGFVGLCITTSTFNNCYARGSVSGNNRTGGFFGEARQSTTFNNCYCTGSVSGTTATGGFGGGVVNAPIANDCYWDTDTSGQTTSVRGTGKTTSELQTPVTNSGIYSAWTIPPWQFNSSSEYPTLSTTP